MAICQQELRKVLQDRADSLTGRMLTNNTHVTHTYADGVDNAEKCCNFLTLRACIHSQLLITNLRYELHASFSRH